MRIAVSAGHGNRDPGAVNVKLGLVENLHAYQIAWLLRDALVAAGYSCEFVSCFQSLGDKIAEVNRLHAEKAVDLAIEIHFNSAANPLANGTECLYYSPKNDLRASRISAAVSKALGTKDRGASRRTNLGWLKRTDPPALIVEVLFISNDHDANCITWRGFHQIVAKAIAWAL